MSTYGLTLLNFLSALRRQVVITPEFKFIVVTATVTPVAGVPEPPVGLLLGAGLMGLLVIGRNKFVRSNRLA